MIKDIDGTYAYVYGGSIGLGAAIAIVRNGAFRIKDTGGTISTGTIKPSVTPPGTYDIVGETTYPAGTWNVGGSSARDMTTKQAFTGSIPDWFATGEPFQWPTPAGPVNAMAFPIDPARPDIFSEELKKVLGTF